MRSRLYMHLTPVIHDPVIHVIAADHLVSLFLSLLAYGYFNIVIQLPYVRPIQSVHCPLVVTITMLPPLPVHREDI